MFTGLLKYFGSFKHFAAKYLSPIFPAAVFWYVFQKIKGYFGKSSTDQPYTFPEARTEIVLSAQRAPLAISGRSWMIIWAGGFVVGLLVYCSLVFWAYSNNQKNLLLAKPTELSFLSASTSACAAPSGQTSDIAKWYGAAFGVADDKVLSKLSAVLCVNQKVVSALPSVAIVEAFLRQDQQCGGDKCSPECANYWRRRFARILGGSFRSGDEELGLNPQPPSRETAAPKDPKATDTKKESRPTSNNACEIAEPLSLGDFWGILAKPSPISAPEVARWLLGAQNCVGDNRDACTLVTRLLQSALDNPDVRTSRTFVNMIWGWERLLVLVLFFVLLLCLFYRSVVRQNLDLQMERTLEKYRLVVEASSLPRKRAPTSSQKGNALFQPAYSEEVYSWFKREFPEEQDNRDFTPIRNLLKVADADEIDLRARVDSDLIAQSRIPLDTIITVFPVIGFVATLWGLITALSSANLIASSTGDERNASVMRVTSELSSCFSTTLLALVFMTGFAVWNILQAKRELALVGNIQDCLLSAGAVRPPRHQYSMSLLWNQKL